MVMAMIKVPPTTSLRLLVASRHLCSSTTRFRAPYLRLISSWANVSQSSIPIRRVHTFKTITNVMPARYSTTIRAFMSSLSSSVSAEPSSDSPAAKSYDAGQIQVLEGLDPVRKLPGMYIGSTGPRGLHHLVYEVLDNAIDEAQAGFATNIDVIIFLDGSVSITDDGRGIPTDLHPVTQKSALETVLTVLHAGGKFGGESSGYNVSGGLHGVGLCVVNALSEKLEVTVWRDGKEWNQTFVCGKAVTELTSHEILGESKFCRGTRVRFWPDKEVFTTNTEFDYNTIVGRARELAFLNPQVKITLKQENKDVENVTYNEYHYVGGLVEYVCWLNLDKAPIHKPISFTKEKDGVIVNVALQWCSDAYTDTLLGYANSIRTSDGGSHMDGVKSALTRTFNILGRTSKLIKEKDESLSGEHVMEGLTGVVSVKVPKPEFQGQTKTRLGNPEVRRIVDQAVQDYLTEYLECNPRVLKSILSKALNAYKAAMAARKARELVRRKSVLRPSALPGKLADCSASDPREAEIFIVEGESAGGSAKQGRDRRFQAILPLHGKILNVEGKGEAAMYKNEGIQRLILGLGLGLKVERCKQSYYCFDDGELKKLQNTFPSNASYNIQRFKGLGEMMPLQLWETTLDPATRKLKQLTVEDAAEANMVFSLLMGNQVESRMELIEKYASKISLEKLDI